MKLSITGANSSVGRNLLSHVLAQEGITAVALARSHQALSSLPQGEGVEARAVAYQDVDALAKVFEGSDSVVHLAGILFETRHSKYREANVNTTAAVVKAANQAGVKHVLFVSVLGADVDSSNPFYSSKGDAENLVTGSGLSATVLRTPLLLGPETAGGKALRREAGSGRAKLLDGGRHWVRPLDVDDLSTAILQACRKHPTRSQILELVGPESIAYRDMVQRVAKRMGVEARITGIPRWSAKAMAAISHTLSGGGMSPAIIDVITASEEVEENADGALGISLTPLDETLAKLLVGQ